MVKTVPPYNPKMVVSDIAPGSEAHPAGKGLIRIALRIMTRQGEVVIDFDEFTDLIGYQDYLSLEQVAGTWSVAMKANVCNIELLRKIHPGLVIEVYCARNQDPLSGLSARALKNPQSYPQELGSPLGSPAESLVASKQPSQPAPSASDYLDNADHLLMRGVITQYGRSANSHGSHLTISGESFGKIYRDAWISTDVYALTRVGKTFEMEHPTLQQGSLLPFYYNLLAEWVEKFWGMETGWEARTRPIPVLPYFFVRLNNSGSVWANLEGICVRGLFHIFVDHTGAIVWEKLPYSSTEDALIPGRNWEDLPGPLEVPSWKKIRWGDRLSQQGVVNYMRCSLVNGSHNGGNTSFDTPGQLFNMGSIRQYGGPREMQIHLPGLIAGPLDYQTTARRWEELRQVNWLQSACVLEALPWYDRPVQRLSLTTRGESAWRIHTRIRLREDWHCGNAPSAEYHVVSRAHQIDIAGGSWITNLDVTRDRRRRYLGIGETAFAGVEADNYWYFDRRIADFIQLGSWQELRDARLNIPTAPPKEVPTVGLPSLSATIEAQPPLNPPQPPPTPGSSPEVSFTHPLPGATVTSPFGPRIHPITGAPVHHDGIDLAAPTGTPVLAAAPGRVVYSAYNGTPTSGYGNLVVVEHADGTLTRYAHLHTRRVQVGDVLSAGQVLGTVGSTGGSTGPHLHFEIRPGAFYSSTGSYGTAIDPAPFLASS